MGKKVLIGLGSNVADRTREIETALLWLREELAVLAVTPPFPTEPDGGAAGAPYLNAVVLAQTELGRDELQRRLKAYEAQRGRIPGHKPDGMVPVDLDLVMYDEVIVKPAEFRSPHFQCGLSSLASQTSSSPSIPIS